MWNKILNKIYKLFYGILLAGFFAAFPMALLAHSEAAKNYHCSMKTMNSDREEPHSFFTILSKLEETYIETGFSDKPFDSSFESDTKLLLSEITKFDNGDADISSWSINKKDLSAFSFYSTADGSESTEVLSIGKCIIFEHINLKQLDTDLDGVMTCLRNSDYRCLSSYTLPKVMDEAGGVSLFIQKFHEITDDLREQGIEPNWSSAAIGTAKPYLGESNFVSLIPYQFSVKINEVEGVVNTFLVGLSSDMGKTWYFFDDTNNEGTRILQQEAPDVYEYLHNFNILTDPSIAIGGKNFPIGQ